jgi:hypothetical protein
MTYKEMQKVLKEYQSKGIKIACKLNASKEVLQAEINKIGKSKTRKSKTSSKKQTLAAWIEPEKITAISPTKLTYKKDGKTVKVTTIANNMSRNEQECKLLLRNAAIAIKHYGKYIDVRICSITQVIEFFVKKEYSKVLGGWDYKRENFTVLAELAELPSDLHKAYLDIRKEVIASI